jgi:hypothetical protein
LLSRTSTSVLDAPFGAELDPDELVRAAMDWHFDPDTGSNYWLERAKSLDFDPRADVNGYSDLSLFPDTTAELRDVSATDLIPKGYGPNPDIVGVFESGGTTGAPKRVVCLRDWLNLLLAWDDAHLDELGFPRDVNWLGMTPSGPHIVGECVRQIALARGGLCYTVDLDPRWVKHLISTGAKDQADAYSEHLVDQAAFVLRSQDVAVLTITPPLLERLARRDELVDLVNSKVKAIRWGGTQLDADSEYLYRTEVFPDSILFGHYGGTMILGFAGQRAGQAADEPCVFDSFAPYVSFSVVDPDTHEPVAYGERGQVVTRHVSKSFLLPNNLERDLATRIEAPKGHVGDSVSGVGPVAKFESETVIEGVY